jgi:hypothetical protein
MYVCKMYMYMYAHTPVRRYNDKFSVYTPDGMHLWRRTKAFWRVVRAFRSVQSLPGTGRGLRLHLACHPASCRQCWFLHHADWNGQFGPAGIPVEGFGCCDRLHRHTAMSTGQVAMRQRVCLQRHPATCLCSSWSDFFWTSLRCRHLTNLAVVLSMRNRGERCTELR